MCGVGEKCTSLCRAKRTKLTSADRRPVDPTPIIQLKVIDGNGEANNDTPDSSKGLRRPEPGPNGMTYMQSN